MIETLVQDVGYAARTLRRNPGFAAVVILTLAIGIGANTSIFTLVDAMLLRTLPVERPEQLVAIGDPARTNSLGNSSSPRADLLSYQMFTDLRDQNHLVSGLFASGRTGRLDVTVPGSTSDLEHPRGRFVSGSYFSVLGVRAYAGRVFDGSEDRAIGGAPVVTISYAYWTRRFNRSADAIGRTLTINGAGFTIIGVAPPEFTGDIVGTSMDVWIPLTMQTVVQPHTPLLSDPQTFWLLCLGRLAPGVTQAQAAAGFEALIRKSVTDHNTAGAVVLEQNLKSLKLYIGPGSKGFSRVRSTYGKPLITLMAGVGLLLLIICGNVANLLLARAVTRTREMSVRLAVGAGRSRLIRQLLTESLVLALLGASGGLVVAWYGSQLLLALAADGAAAIPLNLRIDVPILVFTGSLSVLAVGLFGLAPALRASRVDLAEAMKSGTRAVGGAFGGHGHRGSIGRVLIAGQVALSVVLLMGAGLLVRSLRGVENTDTGLDRPHLLIVDVDAVGRGYAEDRKGALALDLAERFGRLPGVQSVTWSANGLFSGTESSTTFQVPGYAAHDPNDTVAYYDEAGPGYARTVGARILAGRDLEATDRVTSAKVILVNETMAKFYWPRGSAIGQTLIPSPNVSLEVVGVIADTKDHDLESAPLRRFYVPYLQRTFGDPGPLRFEIRTRGEPVAITNAVRAEIKAVDPLLAIDGVNPLELLMRASIREARLLTRLAGGFGVLALLLAAIGLYGVLTYAITQRTGEMGLRTALGAQRGDLIGMVLRDALTLVGIGAVAGIPLALGAMRLIRNQLHGMSAADPTSLAAALIVLGLSATLAALLPAWRASRVTPLVALRQE